MSAISELKKRTKSGNIVAEAIAQSGGSGGGAGVFWVNITSTDGGTTWTADKTYAEILAAFNAGQYPIAIEKTFGSDYFEHLVAHLSNIADDGAYFAYTADVSGSKVNQTRLSINSDNTVTVENYRYPST